MKHPTNKEILTKLFSNCPKGTLTTEQVVFILEHLPNIPVHWSTANYTAVLDKGEILIKHSNGYCARMQEEEITNVYTLAPAKTNTEAP